jgi:8-oxo-dGTP pyrophosphatase MutT (NUDIX family)
VIPTDHTCIPPYRSLILLSPNEPSPDGFDYKVCLLERGSHISNASATVFPGGNLDPVDYEAARVYGGESSDTANEDNLPMQALRACAVRETFEEVGVLLSSSEYTTPPEGSEYKAWRKELSTNPSFFLEIYPRLKTSDSKPQPPLDQLIQ